MSLDTVQTLSVYFRTMSAMHPTLSTDDLTSRVNRNIRVELARRGVKVLELADETGLSHAALFRRLNGTVSWNLEELATVADFLQVDPTSLLAP